MGVKCAPLQTQIFMGFCSGEIALIGHEDGSSSFVRHMNGKQRFIRTIAYRPETAIRITFLTSMPRTNLP